MATGGYTRGRNALAAIATVIAMLAAPAIAAPDSGDDVDPFGQGLSGIAGAIGQGLGISANVNTLFDSNILRAGDGIVLRPGAQRNDVRITPSARVSYSRQVGRQRVFITGDAGRDYYIHNNKLDRNRFGFGGGANLTAGSRCTGLLSADFSSRQRIEADVVDNVPNLVKSLDYGLSATCASPVGFGVGGSIEHNQRRNGAASRQAFDLDSTLFSPRLIYTSPTIGQFSLTGSLNRVRYPNRFVPDPDGNAVKDGVDIWSGGVNYSRSVGARLNFSIGASYLKVKPTPSEILVSIAPPTTMERQSFSGAGYNSSITYVAGPRLTVMATASRNVTANPNVGASFQLRNLYGVDVSYALRSSLSLDAGATYRKSEYRGSLVNLGPRRLEDRINRVYAQLTYSPPRIYSVSFELAHLGRKSNPDIYNYNSTSAILRLRVALGRSA